jgi:hypothetical protein
VNSLFVVRDLVTRKITKLAAVGYPIVARTQGATKSHQRAFLKWDKNETPKMALGDREAERRFRRHFPHTETTPYLRNAAVSRCFERSALVGWWRPDWLAGAGGFEPLHQEFVSRWSTAQLL